MHEPLSGPSWWDYIFLQAILFLTSSSMSHHVQMCFYYHQAKIWKGVQKLLVHCSLYNTVRKKKVFTTVISPGNTNYVAGAKMFSQCWTDQVLAQLCNQLTCGSDPLSCLIRHTVSPGDLFTFPRITIPAWLLCLHCRLTCSIVQRAPSMHLEISL